MTTPVRFELANDQVHQINTWSEYEKAVRHPNLEGWAFRGQGSSLWPVESSLSRYLRNYRIHPAAWAIQERRILSLFQRKAHLFLDHIPANNDYFHWLGLMQHHGAPTRLIDFTWSPEVAAFFALERAQLGKKCAVWAIATSKLWNATYRFSDKVVGAKSLSLREPANYEEYYLNNEVPFVSTDDPFIMNQRIIAQSGTFVVPGVLDRAVEEIVTDQGSDQPEAWIRQFVMDVDEVRADAMAALYRMDSTEWLVRSLMSWRPIGPMTPRGFSPCPTTGPNSRN